jgi:hypothetical protein
MKMRRIALIARLFALPRTATTLRNNRNLSATDVNTIFHNCHTQDARLTRRIDYEVVSYRKSRGMGGMGLHDGATRRNSSRLYEI